MLQNSIIITNIQRFSLHDGPGIRTTIFLKGCTIRCPWCSNPENLSPQKESYVKDSKKGIYGNAFSCESLYKEIIKDKLFFTEGCNDYNIRSYQDLKDHCGGVTFSGGEALMQMLPLIPLLQTLKGDKIHMAIETSLFAAPKQMDIALQYIDLFYVDVKLLNSNKCKSVLCGDLNQYIKNVDKLFSWKDETGYRKPVVLRVPVIGGYTDMEENRKEVVKFIKSYKPLKVEIIKEHNLGVSKYESLGKSVPDYKGVSDALMVKYKEEMEVLNVPVEICSI
ncbi:MAG: 4Fe-4S cluster-binding domain-containing protein [Lachnospiraceae bacterium]|nr:4Fe-4S cluster-binding domain-containing protein [Lachnospiraceae bacterium]